jgi:excisionase family DNA binding protein
MMTVREVAGVLKISLWKTYRLIEREVLGHQRFGGSIRVTEGQLADYLRRTEHTPKKAVRPKRKAEPLLYITGQRRTRAASRRIK